MNASLLLNNITNGTSLRLKDLLPWELDVMTSLLSNYLETMEMKRKQAHLDQQAMM